MRIRLTSTLSLLAAALLLIGCGTDRTNGVDPAQIQYVPILEQAHGDNADLTEPLAELIRSQEALEALDAEIPLAEQVDFETQSLIVLAAGEQRTGGYWARILGVQRVGDELWLQGVINQPGEDAAATQQITHPYAAAIIPRPADDVQLRRQIDTVTGRDPAEFDDTADTTMQPAE
ncbi:MAG: protease complex subunit PrcB family protein [Phycisphaeraceae bacterium]